MNVFKGFEPVFSKDSRVLILGSFPSVISREVDFYYGNKRNRFWSVLERIFGEKIPENKDGKIDFLLRKKIALWDMLSESSIEGSSDAQILKDGNYKNSDISFLLSRCDIEKILLNGKLALKLFEQNCSFVKTEHRYLPSTSPANVSFDFAPWESELKFLL